MGQSKSSLKFQKTIITKKEVQTKIDSAKILFPKNPIRAFNYVEKAITMATNSGYETQLANAYFTLAGFNVKMNENSSAIIHTQRALPIYKKVKNWKKTYQCYMVLGKSNYALTNYIQAEGFYKNAINLAEKGSVPHSASLAKFELATTKMAEKNYAEAKVIFTKLKEKIGESNPNLAAEIDLKLGEISEQIGDLNEAAGYYQTASNNAFENKNNDLLTRSNSLIIETYNKGNSNIDEAFINQTLNDAEQNFAESYDTVSLLTNSIQKADVYVAQGNLSEAVSELNKSYTLSSEYGDLDAQLSTSKKLYEVYTLSDNADEAVKAYDNYNLLLDSLKELKTKKNGVDNQNQFALRSIEKQIDNLERERKLDQKTIKLLEREKNLNSEALQQQRTLLYVFGFLIIVFIAVGIFVYRNNKAKKRAHQLLYLKSLRAQMNPHFIFNSLNSVNNYISKNNERAANKYLSKFSKLMRQILEYSQDEFITLSKEIEMLRLYVELEHERFKDKFDFKFTIDDSINTDGYTVPPMLIQPFIENSIWHGLRYKKSAGLLEVSFKDKTDYVEITVRDNGIGREKSHELKTINRKKHVSTGMKNVENRTELIQTVFKAKIKYTILDLPNNGGTEVKIKLYRNE